VFLLERACSEGLLEWVVGSITEFRCEGWDEGCEEGAGSDVFVVRIKEWLNVYKRVISTQIMPKPTIGLCSKQL
jgi:hypothetical protein